MMAILRRVSLLLYLCFSGPIMIKMYRKNKGFTLIELLIVVSVIGVLAAIAVPIFSGYRQKSCNAMAVSDLRSSKIMLEAYYSDNKYYP